MAVKDVENTENIQMNNERGGRTKAQQCPTRAGAAADAAAEKKSKKKYIKAAQEQPTGSRAGTGAVVVHDKGATGGNNR